MIQKPTPKFIPCPNDSACGPTVLAMIVQYFEKDWQLNWPEIYQMMAYEDGKWSNAWCCLGAMAERGYRAICHSDATLQEVTTDVLSYYQCVYGDDYVALFKKHADFEIIQKRLSTLPKFLGNNFEWINQLATEDDVKKYLDEGYLLHVWVDPYRFGHQEEKGKAGHFVLFYDYFVSSANNKPYYKYHDGGSTINGQPSWYIQGGNVSFEHLLYSNKACATHTGLKFMAFKRL